MRRHWLDNLRWVTVVLVLIYHVFYFYNNKGVFGGIGGFVDDPMGQPQDVVMYILYPWFMMLLFLVAGISARYSLQKRSAKEFCKSRTLKLLVPSTIGLFVFHWMTGYFNTRIANPFGQMPLLIKWPLLSISGCGPLWFIQDLWLFSILLLLIRKLDVKDGLWALCGKASTPVIILLGLLVWAGSQALIMNPRPESADGLYNLYKPLTYFIPFLLGYFVFFHDEVQERVERMHLPMLICAVIAGVALIWTGWGKCNTDPKFLAGWLNCLYAWLMILAMLGCFKAWFDRSGPFASYMSRSSFGIYIVHYLVVAALGTMLKEYTGLAPWAIYAVLIVAVLLLSPAIYELIKRIPFLRWCVLGAHIGKKRPLLVRKKDCSEMRIIRLSDNREMAREAAEWFSSKWSVPKEAYVESIQESFSAIVPSWYLCLDGDRIVAGMGVIENDFHDRKDLTPNVCAVYTEEEYRCRGIAGRLLDFVCRDMASHGIGTLYLLTNHTGFYERYGWEFFCLANGDGEDEPSRMYVHNIDYSDSVSRRAARIEGRSLFRKAIRG